MAQAIFPDIPGLPIPPEKIRTPPMWSHFRSLVQGTLLLMLCAVATLSQAQPFTVTIEAGDVERRESIATFKLPPYFGPLANEGHLEDAKGNAYRFQVIGDEASLIVPRLSAGRILELSYTASRLLTRPSVTPSTAGITVTNVGGQYIFLSGNQRLLEYQSRPSQPPAGTPAHFAHAGYLHRVFSPSGKLVTADYPPDHPHQRGIFFAWTKTEHDYRESNDDRGPVTGTNVAHPDFWNMGKDGGGQLSGEVVAERISRIQTGPIFTSLTAKHAFRSHLWEVYAVRSPSPRFLGRTDIGTGDWLRMRKPSDLSDPASRLHTNDVIGRILSETWEISAYNIGFSGDAKFLCFDLESRQLNVYPGPLRLPKYHYGGLGVRGSAQWDPVERVTMFTSNGDDRKAGDATKAKWVWMGGEVDGGLAGILVLIHPQNFRFPQPLRLNPKNPQLCVAPSADGDWEIKPGETYVSRYRFVVMDGKPTAAEAERFWQDYANPVKVTVK